MRDANMTESVRLLGIGGSTRAGSLSLAALEAALGVAREAGARTTLAAVHALDLPLYRADRRLEDHPAALAWLLDEVRAADAVLLCSPTYHGTVAGGVKNALDALNFLAADTPPYFGGKPVGLMALGGAGATNVINSLQHATRALGGISPATVAIVPPAALDPATGRLRDEAVRARLTRLAAEVLDLARRLRQPGPPTQA